MAISLEAALENEGEGRSVEVEGEGEETLMSLGATGFLT